MDKPAYYKIIADLEDIRSQIYCVAPKNLGICMISSDLTKIMERVVQYKNVLIKSQNDTETRQPVGEKSGDWKEA